MFLYCASTDARLTGLFHNALLGTFLDTKSTGNAFVIINDSMIVGHMNGIKLADLFTLLAANAGVLTGLHGSSAHILGRAEYIYFFLLCTQGD